jgi:polysaccharide biosynthesis/export protein
MNELADSFLTKRILGPQKKMEAGRGKRNIMQNNGWLSMFHSPSQLRGNPVRGAALHTFRACVLLAAVSCLVLRAQSTASNPQDATPNNQVTAASAQTDSSSRSTRYDDTFVIGNDDVLAINVWKDPDLTKQVTVRSDGKISMPLIGDIQAAGRTPPQLEVDITDRLKGYITDPQVAVIVQEVHSLKFNVLGQVTKPGSYPLTTGTTVVDALAIAGGLKDFAKKKGIYVLRPGPSGNEYRYTFNYDDFVKGKNTKQNITLRPRDTVVVP